MTIQDAYKKAVEHVEKLEAEAAESRSMMHDAFAALHAVLNRNGARRDVAKFETDVRIQLTSVNYRVGRHRELECAAVAARQTLDIVAGL